MIEIIVPQEDVNTEFIVMVEWIVDERAKVKKGDSICCIETSKSVLEIEAPEEGVIHQILALDKEAPVSTPIGYIFKDEIELKEYVMAPKKDSAVSSGLGKATKKALKLAESEGVDIAQIKKTGLITEKDVALFINTQKEKDKPMGILWSLLADINLSGISFPKHMEDERQGKLEPMFLEEIKLDEENFRALSSDEKIKAYRDHGASIGQGVTIGKDSIILAPQIILDDNARVGSASTIMCREKFVLGELSLLGDHMTINIRQTIIGSLLYSRPHIDVGGGGYNDPWAVLIIGDSCYLGESLIINPCRPIVLGKNVFLTMRSILITHNIGHSPLEGFENRFAPIIIEDRAQVGMNSTLYAGIRLGYESIIGSNSYVVNSIPRQKLAMGVPAKVVRDSFTKPSPVQQEKMVHDIIFDLTKLLAANNIEAEMFEEKGGKGLKVKYEKMHYLLWFTCSIDKPASFDSFDKSVFLALHIDESVSCEDDTYFDLLQREVKGETNLWSETIREYLRKRGITFSPGPWRYSGGLL